MNSRLLAIMRKEVWHILRDWQTLIIVLAMPVFMMFLFGYALDVNMRDVPVLVEDPSPSPESRAIARAIDESELFKVLETIGACGNIEELFRARRIKAVFRMPPDFASRLRRAGSPPVIQVLIDGSDQNQGTIIRNAVEPFLQKASLQLLGIAVPSVITVHQVILYNPQQKSALFFVPGLMALILLMISALLTSLTITREKELGTMEQLLISPLRPSEILIGKIVPYIFLAAIDGALIMTVGYFAFGVAVAGSAALLAIAAFVYIFASLSLGLLFSTLARKQEQAMLIVMPVTMLPTVMLSGFIFPLSSMPWPLQTLSFVVPATYFLEIIRGVILKGIGLSILWKPLLVLSLMGVFLVGASIRAFRVKS